MCCDQSVKTGSLEWQERIGAFGCRKIEVKNGNLPQKCIKYERVRNFSIGAAESKFGAGYRRDSQIAFITEAHPLLQSRVIHAEEQNTDVGIK